MKNLHILLVTVLLAWPSYSSIGYGIVGPFTASAFKCLHSTSPAPLAMIRGYQHSRHPAGIDPHALQTINNSHKAGWNAAPYLELCRGIDAASQVNLIYDQILLPFFKVQNSIIKVLFIKVRQSKNANCSWAGYSSVDNCKFLKNAINAIRKLTYPQIITKHFFKAYIDSTANIWKKFFANDCEDIYNDPITQFVYGLYDKSGKLIPTRTLDDFVPFGGCDFPLIKQIMGNVKIPLLCGSVAWHALVDVLWTR